jgi:hypothetical protein
MAMNQTSRAGLTPVARIRVGRDPSSAPEREAGKDSPMGDFRDDCEGEPIKFGSFSLGDVFDRETKNWGDLHSVRKNQQVMQRQNSWKNSSDYSTI